MNRVPSLTYPVRRSDGGGVAYASVMESPDQLPVFVTRDGDVFHARADQFGVTADGSDFVGALVNLEAALRPQFPDGVVPGFAPTGPAADEDYPEAERLADIEIWDNAVAAGDDYISIEQLFAEPKAGDQPDD